MLLATIALTSLGVLTLNHLQAQPPPDGTPTAPPASVPPPGAPGAPGTPGGPARPRPYPPQFRGRMRNSFQPTFMSLKHAKMELERSTDDFGGHRQSAIDACDKAIQELDAVIKAQAAAARQLPPPGGPGNPGALQAPAPPQAPPQ